MSFQKYKSDSVCVGGRHRSSTSKIFGDITSECSKVLIGYCSFRNKKTSMTISDNVKDKENVQMDRNENSSACNTKLDKDNYIQDRTVWKNCFNKKKRKNNDNTLIQNQKQKIGNIKITILIDQRFSLVLVFPVGHTICRIYFHEYLTEIFTRSPNHPLSSIRVLKPESRKKAMKLGF